MKQTIKNRTVVDRKTDSWKCVLVSIMGKLIPIGSVINLEKKSHQPNYTHF